MDERLQQLYCSKLLSIVLEVIMLLVVCLLEFDEFVPLLGNFIIVAVPQVEQLIFNRLVLFLQISVQVLSEVFLVFDLIHLM